MVLRNIRDVFVGDTTLGNLSIIYDGGLAYNGKAWVPSTDTAPKLFGTTLEDTDRGLDQAMSATETAKIKVATLTAIGIGRNRMLVAMSSKRKRLVMWLDDVTGYRAVQAHRGNRATNTDGCPLVGLHRVLSPPSITDSIKAEEWLLARVQECIARGEAVWWETQRDPAAWAAAQARR